MRTSDVGKPVLRLQAEAIEEFRVVTVGANADEGRSSAAQINLVTKSGSNSWHGSAFEFHRNTIFSANDFFNNRSGVDRPKLIRNTFGGALGGPIAKDSFSSSTAMRDGEMPAAPPLLPWFLWLDWDKVSWLSTPNVAHIRMERLRLVIHAKLLKTLRSLRLSSITSGMWCTQTPFPLHSGCAAAKYPSNDNSLGDGIMTGGFRFKRLNAGQIEF